MESEKIKRLFESVLEKKYPHYHYGNVEAPKCYTETIQRIFDVIAEIEGKSFNKLGVLDIFNEYEFKVLDCMENWFKFFYFAKKKTCECEMPMLVKDDVLWFNEVDSMDLSEFRDGYKGEAFVHDTNTVVTTQILKWHLFNAMEVEENAK